MSVKISRSASSQVLKFCKWLVLFALLLIICCQAPDEPAFTAWPDNEFLENHWDRPFPSQGIPPDNLPTDETALEPEACAKCHRAQFTDWSQSVHSNAMGPGLIGQFLDMMDDPESIRDCMSCHAPLAEQFDLAILSMSGAPVSSSSDTAKPLHESGIICATCHVRQYTWYGPPRKTSLPPLAEDSPVPHNGWVTKTEFSDSKFCICHQFAPDDFALNGKLIENTYEEWRASRFNEEKISCQSCHMPNRLHTFKGIHDAEMTRNGVDISSQLNATTSDIVNGQLVLKNSRVGHHFPTYVTPRIYMNGFQQDVDSKLVPGSFRQYIIARDIPVDLSQEYSDTRIPSGDSAILFYDAPLESAAVSLIFRIWVEPDEFYTRFFESLLENNQTNLGRSEIEQALANSRASTYILYEAKHVISRDS